MKYFKDKNNEVFAYDDEQIKMGLADDKTEITEAEKDELTYVAPTAEQLLQQAKAEGEIYSLNGTDYKVPFMKDDADGLLQVKAAFDLGVGSTNIHFTNGTVMPITAAEFMDFAIWFVNKRNSFFME